MKPDAALGVAPEPPPRPHEAVDTAQCQGLLSVEGMSFGSQIVSDCMWVIGRLHPSPWQTNIVKSVKALDAVLYGGCFFEQHVKERHWAQGREDSRFLRWFFRDPQH